MKHLVLLLFLFISCDDDQLNAEQMREEMDSILVRIEAITTTDCSSDESCKAKPIGAKSCGGPTHYIIYSSTIDEQELDVLIAKYNAFNEDLNLATGAISDCANVPKPELECVSGMCKEVNLN